MDEKGHIVNVETEKIRCHDCKFDDVGQDASGEWGFPCCECRHGNRKKTASRYVPKNGIDPDKVIAGLRRVNATLRQMNTELEQRLDASNGAVERIEAGIRERFDKAAENAKSRMDDGAKIFRTVDERIAFKTGVQVAITIMSCEF